jgi:predicted DNA-binding transcriptional regulator AlpA
VIPADLVPLSRVASRLAVDSRLLVERSAIGDFPKVYEVAPRRWRVSESAVGEWLESRDASSVLARDELHRRRLSYLLRDAAPSFRTP